MTQLYPPRTRLDDDRFMAVWPRMGECFQRELQRLERENLRGIAILKDRMMKRKKYDMTGFYGLELLDEEVYRAEQTPAKADDLKEARERAADIRAKLADDEQFIADRMRQNEELEPFHQMAEASGKTLPEVLHGYIGMEASLKEDLIGGIFALCDNAGADPIAVLTTALQAPAHSGAAN
jgi:hypothetical protein